MFGKKSSQKIVKYLFLFKHEYRDQKMVEKKAGNNYSRNTPIVQAKNVWKKTSQNIAKKRFLYTHEYRDKKMVEKTRETIFPETHQ